MSKNTKGKGGKNRRRGKGHTIDDSSDNIILKEDGQEYAQVIRLLGSGRLEGQCYDGQTRICIIRGKMRKKVWVNQGDFILVGLRDFQDGKADVIHKYTSVQARKLKTLGELPENAKINEGSDILDGEHDDIPFDFEDI